MLKPMIRTIDRWRFEMPLALTLGAAVAFVTIAAPHEYFGGLPGSEASGTQVLLQDMVAVVVALFATSIAYLTMRRSSEPGATIVEGQGEGENDWLEPKDVVKPKQGKAAKPAKTDAAPPVSTDPIPAEPKVRLRRADAHPDAPPRAPIRASRDLGEPFMDIDGFAPPPPLAPLVVPPVPSFLEGDFQKVDAPAPKAIDEAPAEIVPVTPKPEPMPVAPPAVAEAVPSAWPTHYAPIEPAKPDPVVEPEPVIETPPVVAEPVVVPPVPEPPVAAVPVAVEPSPIEAFEPEAEPMPAPVRPARQSLGSMMERLSSGLERRNGQPLAPPPASAVAEALSGPRDVKPELRNALDELNRLAARRD